MLKLKECSKEIKGNWVAKTELATKIHKDKNVSM